MMKENHFLPILKDPVSQSFVYQRNSLTMYKEVLKLKGYLTMKFEEEVKKFLKIGDDDDLELGGMGRMGGMNHPMGRKRMGMGAMGRRHY